MVRRESQILRNQSLYRSDKKCGLEKDNNDKLDTMQVKFNGHLVRQDTLLSTKIEYITAEI